MSVLQLFATPEELQVLLAKLVADHNLRTYHYASGRLKAIPDTHPRVVSEGAAVPRLFLARGAAPPPEPTVPEPRDRGWLDVVPGRVSRGVDGDVLTLTTIQAEDRKNLSFKPTAWLRALKRYATSEQFRFGVRGTNVVHGGDSEYRKMGYSPEALKLYRAGARWKYAPTDNLEFQPESLSQGSTTRR